MALDFTKAFDSVRWSLTMEVLKWFNIGENFIGYIKLMFIEIESCLSNSGFSSLSFNPG